MNPTLINTDDEFEQALADGATVRFGPDIWEEILDDIYRAEDANVKAKLAGIRQARIKHASDIMTHMWTDTTGTPVHKTDVEAYHAWAWRFRDKNDVACYDCWNDDGFVREWLRDNEDVRVKLPTGGALNRAGWTAAQERGMTKREGQNQKDKFTLTDERGNAVPPPEVSSYRKLPENVIAGKFSRNPKTAAQ